MLTNSQSLTSTQLKRTLHNSTPYDEPADSESNIEELISRIQSAIFQTSESMKQQLFTFEEQELINYKNDLLKTQEEFIKIRAQRNQGAIKSSMLKEKAQVQEKFNTEIRKSMEMNAKYEQMKSLVRKMNEDQKEIMMEINYIKKKIQKQTKQGQRLDEELEEIQRKIQRRSPKKGSKFQEERKLFTDLVNKCEPDNSNGNKRKKTQKQDEANKMISLLDSVNRKMERRLKYEISNLKDYIDNIPLDLNFVEGMLYKEVKAKFDEKKGGKPQGDGLKEVKEEVNENKEEEKIENKDQTNEHKTQQNAEGQNQNQGQTQQSKQTPQKEQVQGKPEEVVKEIKRVIHKKLIKLPSITQTNILSAKSPKKKGKNKQNGVKSTKTPISLISQPPKPIQVKCRIVEKEKQGRENQDIPELEQLPKSSGILEEILTNQELKEYLYKILFGSQMMEE